MKRNVSVVHLIVATLSSGPPASGKIIKEMPGSVASGTPYIIQVRLVSRTHLLYPGILKSDSGNVATIQFTGVLISPYPDLL